MNVNCHHANQDKFWVKDPDGVEWEVYYLNYNLLRAKRPRRRAGRAARCRQRSLMLRRLQLRVRLKSRYSSVMLHIELPG